MDTLINISESHSIFFHNMSISWAELKHLLIRFPLRDSVYEIFLCFDQLLTLQSVLNENKFEKLYSLSLFCVLLRISYSRFTAFNDSVINNYHKFDYCIEQLVWHFKNYNYIDKNRFYQQKCIIKANFIFKSLNA